ncbi:hypothetical protein ABH924_004409 [Arthrobacter sp. GAS37]
MALTSCGHSPWTRSSRRSRSLMIRTPDCYCPGAVPPGTFAFPLFHRRRDRRGLRRRPEGHQRPSERHRQGGRSHHVAGQGGPGRRSQSRIDCHLRVGQDRDGRLAPGRSPKNRLHRRPRGDRPMPGADNTPRSSFMRRPGREDPPDRSDQALGHWIGPLNRHRGQPIAAPGRTLSIQARLPERPATSARQTAIAPVSAGALP